MHCLIIIYIKKTMYNVCVLTAQHRHKQLSFLLKVCIIPVVFYYTPPKKYPTPHLHKNVSEEQQCLLAAKAHRARRHCTLLWTKFHQHPGHAGGRHQSQHHWNRTLLSARLTSLLPFLSVLSPNNKKKGSYAGLNVKWGYKTVQGDPNHPLLLL